MFCFLCLRSWQAAAETPAGRTDPRRLVRAVPRSEVTAGIPLCFAAVVRLARGFPKGELFTSGPYVLCRHPIYASWIVFNVPAFVLLADNWVGLLCVVPMYIALRILVRHEEAWLERTFGDAYRSYRSRVGLVLPIPRFSGGQAGEAGDPPPDFDEVRLDPPVAGMVRCLRQ